MRMWGTAWPQEGDNKPCIVGKKQMCYKSMWLSAGFASGLILYAGYQVTKIIYSAKIKHWNILILWWNAQAEQCSKLNM